MSPGGHVPGQVVPALSPRSEAPAPAPAPARRAGTGRADSLGVPAATARAAAPKGLLELRSPGALLVQHPENRENRGGGTVNRHKRSEMVPASELGRREPGDPCRENPLLPCSAAQQCHPVLQKITNERTQSAASIQTTQLLSKPRSLRARHPDSAETARKQRGGQPRPAAPTPHADEGCQREQLRGPGDQPPGLRGAHPPRASFPASLPTSFPAPAPPPTPPPASERRRGRSVRRRSGPRLLRAASGGGGERRPSPPLRSPGRARRCPRLPPPPAPPGRWERRQLPLKSARRRGDDATQLSAAR